MTAPRILLLLLLATLASAAAGDGDPPAQAVLDGNRLVRDGQLEAALEAYRGGYDPAHPDPLLAYNLAVTAHRLGRLPEAVLWYRRAQRLMPGDDWLADNLGQARRALGGDGRPAPGLLVRLGEHRSLLLAVAVVLSWAGLGLWLAAPRLSRSLAGTAAVLALVLFAAAALSDRLGPRAAVLLTTCPAAPGWPPGSELWVRPADGGWRLAGSPDAAVCPLEALELVSP